MNAALLRCWTTTAAPREAETMALGRSGRGAPDCKPPRPKVRSGLRRPERPFHHRPRWSIGRSPPHQDAARPTAGLAASGHPSRLRQVGPREGRPNPRAVVDRGGIRPPKRRSGAAKPHHANRRACGPSRPSTASSGPGATARELRSGRAPSSDRGRLDEAKGAEPTELHRHRPDFAARWPVRAGRLRRNRRRELQHDRSQCRAG
jgi:hypothetical protein